MKLTARTQRRGINHEMGLHSPTEHKNADLRHAGMDSRHPGRKDAFGNIHVNLDSSTPCWNDAIAVLLELTEAPPPLILKGENEVQEQTSYPNLSHPW
jgi:hypothetical protein